MLDTNVFNAIRDGVDIGSLIEIDGSLIVTSIQMREIRANPDKADRDKLLKIYSEINPRLVPTESAVYGISEFDLANFSDGVSYQALLDALNSKKWRSNNTEDILIAQTSIQNGWTLVTSDKRLSEVVNHFGGKVIHFPYGSTPK